MKKNKRCPLIDFHVFISTSEFENFSWKLKSWFRFKEVRLLLNFVPVGCLVNVVDNALTSISFTENISSLSQTGNCWATASLTTEPLLFYINNLLLQVGFQRYMIWSRESCERWGGGENLFFSPGLWSNSLNSR